MIVNYHILSRFLRKIIFSKANHGWYSCLFVLFIFHVQKQPSRGVLRKRCSENMQQMYRRTPMSKCDFNKVALGQLEACFCEVFGEDKMEIILLIQSRYTRVFEMIFRTIFRKIIFQHFVRPCVNFLTFSTAVAVAACVR